MGRGQRDARIGFGAHVRRCAVHELLLAAGFAIQRRRQRDRDDELPGRTRRRHRRFPNPPRCSCSARGWPGWPLGGGGEGIGFPFQGAPATPPGANPRSGRVSIARLIYASTRMASEARASPPRLKCRRRRGTKGQRPGWGQLIAKVLPSRPAAAHSVRKRMSAIAFIPTRPRSDAASTNPAASAWPQSHAENPVRCIGTAAERRSRRSPPTRRRPAGNPSAIVRGR